MLKIVDGKLRVVALHRGGFNEKYLNCGSLFSAIPGHAFCGEGKILIIYLSIVVVYRDIITYLNLYVIKNLHPGLVLLYV